MVVEEAYENANVVSLLDAYKQPGPVPAWPTPAPTAPSADPEEHSESSVQLSPPPPGGVANPSNRNKPEAKQKSPDKDGRLLPVGTKNLSWKTVDERSDKLIYPLQKTQKRSISFDYILETATRPKWYRFKITVSSHPKNNNMEDHAEKERAWESQTFLVLLQGGDASEPSLVKKCGETVYKASTAPYANEPVPISGSYVPSFPTYSGDNK